jgi:chromate transporter
MIYLQLFWSFFQVGLFTIGGGYAAIPLIQQQIVDIHGWLTMGQFADVVTISQMCPGAIGINTATFVGTKVGGIWGSVVATFGSILPAIFIVLFLAYMYTKYRNLKPVQGVLKGLRPAVVGLIASAGISIIATALWSGTLKTFSFGSLNFVSIGIFAAALVVLQKWKISPILVVVVAGAVGLGLFSFIG